MRGIWRRFRLLFSKLKKVLGKEEDERRRMERGGGRTIFAGVAEKDLFAARVDVGEFGDVF